MRWPRGVGWVVLGIMLTMIVPGCDEDNIVNGSDGDGGGPPPPAGIGRPGMNGPVNALGTFDGKLVAGGIFDMAGGDSALGIALWDGSEWTTLGRGVRADNDSASVVQGIPCITTMEGAMATVEGLDSLARTGFTVKSIQEYCASQPSRMSLGQEFVKRTALFD